MQGVLLVDKPVGWTSFDVVHYIRNIIAQLEQKKPKHIKVGHSGTLDPFATGLLIILIGKPYTRRAGEFLKLPKTYLVEAKLGRQSSTGDPEGTLTPISDLMPSERQLIEAMTTFIGKSKQVPPQYSAIKINGKRAYQLARQGQIVALEPREINISTLTLNKYTYPDFSFISEVSSGTYIRTLVEDIGQKLNTGAYTANLRRLQIGTFSIDHAITVQDITAESVATLVQSSVSI